MARFRFGEGLEEETPAEPSREERPAAPDPRPEDPPPPPREASPARPALPPQGPAAPMFASSAPDRRAERAERAGPRFGLGRALSWGRPRAGAAERAQKRQPIWIALGLLALTALYCLAEIAYNLSLVEFVSAADTSVEEFERLESFGKWLAAIGLALFVSRQIPRWWGLAAFLALSPIAYQGISWGFDAAIRSLPPETQRQGYYLGAYRNLVVNGHIEDRIFLPSGEAKTPADKLALANMPLAAFGSADIPGVVSEWVYGGEERTASMANALESLWSAKSAADAKVEPYWGIYALESKKVADQSGALRSAAEKIFVRYAGMPPGLPKEEFLARASQGSPALAAFREAYAIPPQPSSGYPGLRMRDIPPFAEREEFEAFMLARIGEAEDAARSAGSDVSSLPDSFRIVSSAFVPPMSMSLSLLSLALNASLLAAGILILLARPFGAGRGFSLAASALSLAAAFALIAAAPPAFERGGMADLRGKAQETLWGSAWVMALDAEAALLSVAAPAMPALREAFLAPPKGVQAQRIEIRKAPAVDNLAELERTLGGMRDASPLDLPEADPSVRVDESRLQERGYYGEVRTEGSNPYLRK